MRTLRITLALGFLLTSCVPKAEYIQVQTELGQLQDEHKKLLKKADENEKDLTAAKEALRSTLNELDKQREETVRQLKEAGEANKSEVESLKKQFERFKIDRRTGMIGKIIPEIALRSGKTLSDAKITEVTASSLKVVHSGGITMASFADLSPELQWEAVWDEDEAKQHEASVAVKNKEDAQNMGTMRMAQSVELALKQRGDVEKRVRELEALIPNLQARVGEQRSALNSAFDRLNSNSGGSGRSGFIKGVKRRDFGDDWNRSEPENSELLTNWQKRPPEASGMDGLANAIRTTRQMGSAASAELEKLKVSLENTKGLSVGN